MIRLASLICALFTLSCVKTDFSLPTSVGDCASRCGPTERCDVPGHLGECSPRVLGDSCSTDADCPALPGESSGHCADGVCCDKGCSGICLSCNSALKPGHCGYADDNTDPRRECGTCNACFLGACAPALPGTDPNGYCPAGQTCGEARVCTPPEGALCKTDDDCVGAQCIGQRCLHRSEDAVFVYPMQQMNGFYRLRGLAVDTTGALTTVLEEIEGSYSSYSFDTTRRTGLVARRDRSGTWTGKVLGTSMDLLSPSAVVAQGRWTYVAGYDPTASLSNSGCPTDGSGFATSGLADSCGIYGFFISPGGDMGIPERIHAASFPYAKGELGWIGLAAMDNGRLVIGYATGNPGPKLVLRMRDTDRWMSPMPVSNKIEVNPWRFNAQPAISALEQGVVVVWREPAPGDDETVPHSHLRATFLSPTGAVETSDMPPPSVGTDPGHCNAMGPFEAARVVQADGEKLVVTLLCAGDSNLDHKPMLASYRHSPPDKRGWTLEPRPALGSFGNSFRLGWEPLAAAGEPLLMAVNADYSTGLSWAKPDGSWTSAKSYTVPSGYWVDQTLAKPGLNGAPILLHATSRESTDTTDQPHLILVRYHP